MAARLIAEFHDAMKRAEESTARFVIERGQALLVDNKRHLCARSPSPSAAQCLIPVFRQAREGQLHGGPEGVAGLVVVGPVHGGAAGVRGGRARPRVWLSR